MGGFRKDYVFFNFVVKTSIFHTAFDQKYIVFLFFKKKVNKRIKTLRNEVYDAMKI